MKLKVDNILEFSVFYIGSFLFVFVVCLFSFALCNLMFAFSN